MFKKILVPSDGSDLAHKAAEFAADLAKVHGAEVIGVYVIDPFPYIGIGDASAVGLQAYLSEAKQAANRSLEVLAASCKQRGVAFVEVPHRRLEAERAKDPLYRGPSFTSIAAHGPHAADKTLRHHIPPRAALVPCRVITSSGST